MNYALAKELKDAGFPFIEWTKLAMSWEAGHFASQEQQQATKGKHGCIMCGYPCIEIDGALYAAPTLEELIEACGDDFSSLAHLDTGWHCIAKELYSGHASTPTEAVARLWLALNKK